MKKTVFTLLTLAMMLVCGEVMAQDCDAIIAPLAQRRGLTPENYNAEKLMYFCVRARSFFYFTDNAPEGAKVFNLSEVVNNETQEPIPANFIPDLNTFSYYAYNFEQLQIQFNYQTLFFRLPRGAEYKYLACRSFSDNTLITDAEMEKLRSQGLFVEE